MVDPRLTETLRGHELDMRGTKLLGKDLKNEILDIITDSQRFVLRPLPAWLRVTHRQFVSLLDYTIEMYQTNDRLFKTPLNVMEVDVDEDMDPVQPDELVLTFDPEEVLFDAGNERWQR